MSARVVPIATARQPGRSARPAAMALAGRLAIPAYVPGRVNRCVQCHHEAFHVGRLTAECGRCGLPLPVDQLRRHP